MASVQAPQFYAQLVQPPWAPPPGVFGPVWSVLYTLMGIAAWLVWREPAGAARRHAIVLFCAQLAVNALWSWLFFQWHLGAWALADIALLGLCVAARSWPSCACGPWRAFCCCPTWPGSRFAAALNYTLWRMNPACSAEGAAWAPPLQRLAQVGRRDLQRLAVLGDRAGARTRCPAP